VKLQKTVGKLFGSKMDAGFFCADLTVGTVKGAGAFEKDTHWVALMGFSFVSSSLIEELRTGSQLDLSHEFRHSM